MGTENRYEKRIEQLRRVMAESGIDAALLTPSGDMQYITGLPRPRREPVETHVFADYLQGVLITPDRVTTIVPYLAHLSVDPYLRDRPWLAHDVVHLPDGIDEPEEGLELFTDLGQRGARLALPKFALAITPINLKERFPRLCFACTEDLISPMRMVKEADELEAMRAAARMADQAFGNVVAKLHPGIREAEVYHELDWQMRLAGADGTSFSTSLMIGRPGLKDDPGSCAQDPLGRTLDAGWVLAFDFGFIGQGWCSDFGRTVYFGEPNERTRQAHMLVAEAQRRAMKRMVGGHVTAREVDAAARDFLTEEGVGHEFIHRLGHGIGIDVHEHPFLCSTDATTLQNGMTFTVEPSLWVDQEYFVRVEDVVLVTPKGGVSFNSTPTFDMIVIE